MAHILVIDDDAPFRGTVRALLERSGHTVVEADNGISGLRQLEDPNIEVVLTDIIMPQMEGLETVSFLRDACPGLPIVAMSGGGRLSAIRPLDLASALGANRVLAKPFSRAELLDAVQGALDDTVE